MIGDMALMDDDFNFLVHPYFTEQQIHLKALTPVAVQVPWIKYRSNHRDQDQPKGFGGWQPCLYGPRNRWE